jgi:hypothetical protein
VLKGLLKEGYPVTREILGRLSPYLTEHIRRFGDYSLDMTVEEEISEGKLRLQNV